MNDDFFLIALAFTILGALILGVWGFVSATMLRQRVVRLEATIARLSVSSDADQAVREQSTQTAPAPSTQTKAASTSAAPPPLPADPTRSAATPPPLPAPLPAPAADLSEPEQNSDPQRHRKALDTESTIGGKLTIWLGGLALAFGGLFLVLYAIENALLGPTARVALGLVFGALVAAAGEWTRRRPSQFALPGFERANIPATLTAAGIFILFAAVFAAHSLYALIGPIIAFILLAALALGVMALALVHGPTLAALGLLASYAVPFLIEADTETITVLAIYVLAVSVAALGVARLRGWLWLALSATGAMVVFGLVFTGFADRGQPILTDLYLAASVALGFITFVWSIHERATDETTSKQALPRPDWLATGALSALVFPILFSFSWSKPLALETVELALLFAVPIAIVLRYPALRYVLMVPAFLGVARYLTMGLPATEVPADLLAGPSLYAAELMGSVTVFATIGVIATLALLAVGAAMTLRSPARAVIVSVTVATTTGLYLVAYLRVDQFAASQLFALFGAVLAMLFHILAAQLHGRLTAGTVGRDGSVAAALIGSLVAAAFAVSVWLEGPALTVALGLIALASTVTFLRYRLDSLRVFTVLSAVPYALRLAWEPLIDPAALIGAPILVNPLLWGYGVPAAGFIAAALLLTRAKSDRWADAMQAIAIAATVATISLLALHAIDPTFAFKGAADRLAGAATLVLVGGGVSLGLARLSERPDTHARTRVLRLAADFLALTGIIAGAIALFVTFNPLLAWPSITVGDGRVVNLIGYAYGLPFLLYGLLVNQGWGKKHRVTMIAATAFFIGLGFFWINLSIRQQFSPSDLQASAVEQAELYTYSAVWLVVALIVLAVGIWRRNLYLRAASGLILVAVVIKVFLVDLAGLTGILRALSFIGLGVVLMGIGLVYQRALRRQMATGTDETEG